MPRTKGRCTIDGKVGRVLQGDRPELKVDGAVKADMWNVAVVEKNEGDSGNGQEEEAGQAKKEGAEICALRRLRGRDVDGDQCSIL